jgi:negative regulator of sigma-B (phosphoserine phosphatase)
MIEWAAAGAALHMNEPSGDLACVHPFEDGVLIAVIDGLGHGPEAAAAARAADVVLRQNPSAEPTRLFERCHEALRPTRGAAMTIASLRRPAEMTWIAVGNVEGILVGATREAVIARGGIVGHRLPPLKPRSITLSPGDTLVFATDGIAAAFADRLDVDGTPTALADAILARHRKGTDDALVVVARWRGDP